MKTIMKTEQKIAYYIIDNIVREIKTLDLDEQVGTVILEDILKNAKILEPFLEKATFYNVTENIEYLKSANDDYVTEGNNVGFSDFISDTEGAISTQGFYKPLILALHELIFDMNSKKKAYV